MSRPEATSRPAPRQERRTSGRGDLRAVEKLDAACVAVDGGRLKLEWGDPPVETAGSGQRLPVDAGRRPGRLSRPLRLPPRPGRDLRDGPSLRAPPGGLLRGCSRPRQPNWPSRGVPEALLVVDRLYGAGSVLRPLRRGHDRALRAPHDASPRACRALSAIRSSPSARPSWATCASSSRAWQRRSASPPSIWRPKRSKPSPGGSPERLSSTTRASRWEQSASTEVMTLPAFTGLPSCPNSRDGGSAARCCRALARDLNAEGVADIGLEVSCTNDAALHLYLSCGFDVMGTEDYYAVSVGRPSQALTWPPCAIEPLEGPASRSVPTASAP